MNHFVPYRNGRRFGTLLGPTRLLEELMTWQPPGSEVVWSAFASPLSVTHGDEGTSITVDMPGVGHEDLDLTFDAGTLAITGKRGEKTYSYSVALGDAIDPDRIEAKLDKGVLSIHAPKRPEARPRKIAVNASAPKTLAAEAK